jgi:hypothetical protein
MRRGAPAVLLAAAALGGCVAFDQGPMALKGAWGGPHIGIDLEGGLGTVQFDCAAGSIDQPIISGGAFSVPGSYRPGQTGAVRAGQIFVSKRATYSGTATKTDMTLSVKLEDGELLGPFTLKAGAPPELAPCP